MHRCVRRDDVNETSGVTAVLRERSLPAPRDLAIGKVRIGMPAVQAALSGYSDLPMRRVARAHGAPYCLHEVVLDRLVLQKGKLSRAILDVADDDHPVGGQLMGSEPDTFGRAARRMADAGYDVVDINFGCPVPKVLGRCRGGYLLGDSERALGIVDRVLDACQGDVPVTVKMRRGIDRSAESERAFFAILDGAFARGVAAVTVHGRTVVQRYEGPSSWEFLARAKRHCGDRVVLGSGDLFSPFDVVRMLHETGVDGVTLARGAIGNPFLFRQVRDLLAGREPLAPTIGEQRRALELHWQVASAFYGPRKAPGRSRAHAIKYAAVHPEPIAVRDAFVRARRAEELEAVLLRFYPEERSDERSARLAEASLAAQSFEDCGVAGGVDG
jgi:nifR3 family TIM-barrel protein